MDDVFNLLKSYEMIGNLEERKIERTEVDGYTISTVWTNDMGYETAIGQNDEWHPVERYKTREEAVDGHNKWVVDLPTLDQIVQLGYGGLVDETVIKLDQKADET